jgi:ethanolamine utilization protein EutA
LGAAEFSVQLSGNTCYLSDPDTLLPRRNLQVLRPPIPLGPGTEVDARAVATAVRDHLAAFGAADSPVALALTWSGDPEYRRLRSFATGIAEGLAGQIRAGHPLYLLLDRDIALTLGRLLHDELGVSAPLLVADGLSLWDFDYVDLGRLHPAAATIPVTVKSLLF